MWYVQCCPKHLFDTDISCHQIKSPRRCSLSRSLVGVSSCFVCMPLPASISLHTHYRSTGLMITHPLKPERSPQRTPAGSPLSLSPLSSSSSSPSASSSISQKKVKLDRQQSVSLPNPVDEFPAGPNPLEPLLSTQLADVDLVEPLIRPTKP